MKIWRHKTIHFNIDIQHISTNDHWETIYVECFSTCSISRVWTSLDKIYIWALCRRRFFYHHQFEQSIHSKLKCTSCHCLKSRTNEQRESVCNFCSSTRGHYSYFEWLWIITSQSWKFREQFLRFIHQSKSDETLSEIELLAWFFEWTTAHNFFAEQYYFSNFLSW